MRAFSCWDQFLCLAFAQLTYRESLRDVEECLGARPDQLYHLGFRSRVCRSTLADANETRDWRIYADLASLLLKTRRLAASTRGRNSPSIFLTRSTRWIRPPSIFV